MENKTISIIVPVYRTEAYLEKCVRSVLAQTDPDWELILVDDGSPDGSGVLCDRMREEDARIRVIHQENAGVSAARNRGLDEAHGAFIVFLDSDDRVEPNYLEWLREKQRADGAQLVVCGYTTETESDRENGASPSTENAPSKPLDKALLKPEEFLAGALKEENGIILSVCLGMFSAEAVGGLRFDTSLAYGEDSLFLAKVLSRIDSVRYEPEPLYRYLVSRDGNTYTEVSLTKQESRIRSVRLIAACWEKSEMLRPAFTRILADLEIVAARLAHDAGNKASFYEHRKAARRLAAELRRYPSAGKKDKLRLLLASASPVHGVDLYKLLKGERNA